MESRHFTLEEAQELVPWLAETFVRLAPLRERLAELNADRKVLRARMQSNGGSDAVKRMDSLQADLADTSDQIREQVEQIQQRGIVVRSFEQGLVDFPSTREGREVCLCWIEGESEVRFWHELSTGFAGRQPL